ncbi:hypothetical protein HJC23_003490 [Cyclotella cryptica]|uniref:LAGLIDADG homing endonuclease n=1 Tax=Cyclotella cryptica TaxID=29204 RepID=A0ABD3QS61_9STRA
MKLIGDFQQANLYHKQCSGDGILHSSSRYDGKGSKLKKMVHKRGTLFKQVLHWFLAPTLSDEDAEIMNNFVQPKELDLNNNGVLLKAKVKAQFKFYQEAKLSLCSNPA